MVVEGCSRTSMPPRAAVESAPFSSSAPRLLRWNTWPSPRECQVLGYHKKHGTTSPLYRKTRAKYPNW